MAGTPVTDISVTYNVALVTVDNLPVDMKLVSDIFNSIAGQNINIDMINQAPPYRGRVNISFTIPSDDLVRAISTLNTFKKNAPGLKIEVDAQNTKLSVFGEGMKNLPGVAAKLFTILAQNGIDVKLVTTSEVDISFLIYEKDVDTALSATKKEFQIE
ncbi:ACT domain-containing protein [Pseudobacteroides cellulosolvens]|uniref:aspartate kinase n=1 Tax=Pseudobacteroides cellulosolvens ATCC 35603 = DSM 2933 TaxID=398512 RepID=A0A0L6JI90_9FIRM|nr:ACT domain-containing protein [Pseudobacteroides cellulosolvens]KNY25435.1 amino acid-binding ACT domain-containing protein [Pseudobacteroides cellulosolvens ATCC 35603 = DSM 2933]